MSNTCDRKREIAFTLNGTQQTVQAFPMARLLDVLRINLGLTGTKEGCGEGECGACAVLIDGVLSNSCLIPVGQVQGATVLTIEGAATDPRFRTVQNAFIDCGGAQCGICTPGMILASVHLLQRRPKPTLEEIREGLSGSICRCTGYQQIFESVADAVRRSTSA